MRVFERKVKDQERTQANSTQEGCRAGTFSLIAMKQHCCFVKVKHANLAAAVFFDGLSGATGANNYSAAVCSYALKRKSSWGEVFLETDLAACYKSRGWNWKDMKHLMSFQLWRLHTCEDVLEGFFHICWIQGRSFYEWQVVFLCGVGKKNRGHQLFLSPKVSTPSSGLLQNVATL